MLKILVLGVLVAGFGAAGYFGEKLMRPAAAPEPGTEKMSKKKELLFNLPLGKFTTHVARADGLLHHVIDIDVYIAGTQSFQDINGAVGRAKLRDATVLAISVLAESDPLLSDVLEDEAKQMALAAQIVRKLYVDFPVVRTARIKSYAYSFAPSI